LSTIADEGSWIDIFIPEQNFVTVQEMAWGDDNKLHRGFALGHKGPEDLEGYAFPAGLKLKNTEVPQADEAEGKVHHQFLCGSGGCLE
jgi:hypothetical protein